MTKPTKWSVCPAKTWISQCIHPVWSESSLSAWENLWSLATHWAHSEDYDQTGRMPRLIRVFAGCTCHFVNFVMLRLIFCFGLEEIHILYELQRPAWSVFAGYIFYFVGFVMLWLIFFIQSHLWEIFVWTTPQHWPLWYSARVLTI